MDWINEFLVLNLKFTFPILLITFLVYCKILYPRSPKKISVFEKSYGEKRIVTVANIITFLGILLAFAGVWFFGQKKFSFMVICLALSGVSDLLDGFAAKKLNQKTRLGEILDPLRDRLLLIIGLWILIKTVNVQDKLIKISFLPLFFGEIGIAVLGFLSLFNWAQVSIKVHLAGKIRQTVHLFILGLFFLNKWNWVFWSYLKINGKYVESQLILIMGGFSLFAFLVYFLGIKKNKKR